MQAPRPPPAPITAFCSVVCQTARGVSYRAGSVCAGCSGSSSRDRKTVQFSGVYLRPTANTPHQAGPGLPGKDLEWGGPRCTRYCSELQSGGHSFHPKESQGRGGNYCVTFPLLHWERGLMSGCDPPTYLPLGSLVHSSSNQHEYALETSRPGCTVKYCQAMLPEEKRRKEPITWASHHTISTNKSQVNT